MTLPTNDGMSGRYDQKNETMTYLDSSEFMGMISSREIPPPLKTWPDTLLFYLLGMVSCELSTGDIMEIGVGGSTHPLCEIAKRTQRSLHLIDNEIMHRIDDFVYPGWDGDHVKKYRIDSTRMDSIPMPSMAYIHIDGSKRVPICTLDLMKSSEIIGPMGIICQDDYNNSRWPTVTFAVNDAINEKKLKMLLVGDSSAWLCKPEDHEKWINIIRDHHEISMLSGLINLVHSSEIGATDDWFFMNGVVAKRSPIGAADYHARLALHAFSEKYLQMPYPQQSRPGGGLTYPSAIRDHQ